MSPGACCYTAWFEAAGLTHLVAWTQLRPDARACWEAAAEAVRATRQAPSINLFRYRLGQQVRWTCEPKALWRITYRASHDNRAEGLRLFYGITHEGSRLIRMAEEFELSTEEDPHG